MPSVAAISASVSLRRGAASPVGRERIALLEAIGAHGSITAAASAVGLSYKGAWDAVQAMNNLFERPVVVARAGGRHGGSAQVTEEGVALISAFRAVEAELEHVIDRVQRRVGEDARRPLRTLL